MIFSICTALLHSSKRHAFTQSVFLALLAALSFNPFAYAQQGNSLEEANQETGKSLSEQKREEIFTEYFKNWYQVEMIVFERQEESAFSAESWPKNINLHFPLKAQFLTPEKPLSELANPKEASPATSADIDNSELLNQLKSLAQNDPLNKKILAAIEQAEIERLTPKEQPYTFLNEALQTMRAEASRIERDRAMRVLFHQVWRQPMQEQKIAPELIITGGDAFADSFELEGSIKLFVSRYLHIHTNLWLAQFEANVGQEESHWPIIPIRPKAPEPTPTPSPLEGLSVDTASAENNPNDVNDENSVEPTGISNQQPLSDTDANNIASSTSLTEQNPLSAQQNNGNLSGEKNGNWDLSFDNFSATQTQSYSESLVSDLLGDYSQLAKKPYVVRHLVTLRQKRRMRSSELHYIDHPRMGILLRIDRYEPSLTPEEAL